MFLLFIIYFVFIHADKESASKSIKHVTIGHSVILTCKLKNISDSPRMILGYTWTKNKVDVTVDSRFTVLMWGGLLVRRMKVDDAGTYKCMAKTLSNEDVPKVYRGMEVKLDILCKPQFNKITEIFIVQACHLLRYLGQNSESRPLIINDVLIRCVPSQQEEAVQILTCPQVMQSNCEHEAFVICNTDLLYTIFILQILQLSS